MQAVTEDSYLWRMRIRRMRKDILEKKEYLFGEQKLKDLRYAAYRGADRDGCEKVCLIRINGNAIDRIDIFRPQDMECGDIYMGRIENSNKNIAASFADIGRKEPVFIPGGYKPGTELPLVIKTLPYREKLAKASADIPAELAEEIGRKAEHALKGAVLYKAPGAFYLSVKEVCETSGAKWVTEDKVLYERARKISHDAESIVLHEDESVSLSALYGLGAKLERVLSPRVNLKSGAEIVITETEAMCVIDVNSARSLAGKDREETFLKLNLEAAHEICTQISARNLSGIILVDFISMKDKKSETILIEELKAGLSLMKPQARFEDITKLGIAEISRKRLSGSIAAQRNYIDSTILLKKAK